MIVHHSVISEMMIQEKYFKPYWERGEGKTLFFNFKTLKQNLKI